MSGTCWRTRPFSKSDQIYPKKLMKKLTTYLLSTVAVVCAINVNIISAATASTLKLTTVGGTINDNSFDNIPTDFLFNVSGLEKEIQSVNLTIENLTHPDLFELELFLISPRGQVLTLAQALVGENLTQTLLSDAGQINIDLGSPPYTGIFVPSGELGLAQPSNISSFAGFESFNPNGTWKLRIYDVFEGNVGTLAEASLEITAVPEPLTLIGAGMAIGFGAAFKRSVQNKN